MQLHKLKPAKGSIKTSKRIGRGQGSGKGGTSTKGHKGAQSRSGYSRKFGFEGGQMPLYRRLPKFGFKNPFRVEYKAINLDSLESLITSETIIDFDFYHKLGLAQKKDKVKILGRGDFSKKVTIHAHQFSETAKTAIESKGGSLIFIGHE